MVDWVTVGLWRFLIPLPPVIARRRVAGFRDAIDNEVGAMSAEHRDVHRFVVEELPRFGAPLPADVIAERLQIPLDRLSTLLDELEARKGFLFRDRAGAVAWAYPVTVELTPHRITFSSGEQLYAA